jgi:hypothetical protein
MQTAPFDDFLGRTFIKFIDHKISGQPEIERIAKRGDLDALGTSHWIQIHQLNCQHR